MSETTTLPAALDMRGRRVLVTGAASGIGRATASALAQLGATLLLSDRAPLAATRAEAACYRARGCTPRRIVRRSSKAGPGAKTRPGTIGSIA